MQNKQQQEEASSVQLGNSNNNKIKIKTNSSKEAALNEYEGSALNADNTDLLFTKGLGNE